MFHGMRNRSISENALVDIFMKTMGQHLSSSWRLKAGKELPDGRRRVDFLLEIRDPEGAKATVVVEAKSQVDPRDVTRLVADGQRLGKADYFMVLAPFLARRTRDLLAEAGAGYADATGNLRFALEKPAVVLELTGAASNPWPEEARSLRSLKGPTAGRVIRALCDFRPPFGIRQLAQRSATSLSSVSRVVAFLQREALVTRESETGGTRGGPITTVDWPKLIRRWTQDYSLVRSNRTQTYLDPRGLPSLLKKVKVIKSRYSVTGSLAASEVAPVAPSRLAVIYVDEMDRAADQLSLKPADAGANVLLAEPFDSVVFERTWTKGDVTFAALSQVAADLLTSPGRGPAEGEELLRWMERNENTWRR